MNIDTPAKKILILAANPKQTSRLRLDEEVRDIKEGLRLSQQRDKFILQQEWAVRPRDVRRAVLDFRPNIIHFSGHGAGSTGLSFEDETGKEKLVTSVALAGLFGQFAKQVECVVLNACYSEEQASAIAQHIDYVIGMNAAIGDKAALEFAVGFYDALVGYDSRYDTYSRIEFSFNIACNAIQFTGVSGDSIPIMKKKPHLGKVEEQPANPPLEGSPTNGIISVSQNQISEHIIAQGQNLSLKEDIAPIEARISPKESTPTNQQAPQFLPIPVEHNNVEAGYAHRVDYTTPSTSNPQSLFAKIAQTKNKFITAGAIIMGISVLSLTAVYTNLLSPKALSSAKIQVQVKGQSSPWLAGMPDNSQASNCKGIVWSGGKPIFSTAPEDSPAEVKGIPLIPGSYLTFTAKGLVKTHFNDKIAYEPEGNIEAPKTIDGEDNNNGISNIQAPAAALLGVFLGAEQPNKDSAPSPLNFRSAEKQDYEEIYPELKQVFFIGDGSTQKGIKQKIFVPSKAKRLYLGTMDNCYWHDNNGTFDVEVTSSK